jgi:hypothetical protein
MQTRAAAAGQYDALHYKSPFENCVSRRRLA